MLMVDIFEEDKEHKEHKLKAKNNSLSRSTIIKRPRPLSINNNTIKQKYLTDVIVTSEPEKKNSNNQTNSREIKKVIKKYDLDNEENEPSNIINNIKTQNINEPKKENDNIVLDKELKQKKDDILKNYFDMKPKEELIYKKPKNDQSQKVIKKVKSNDRLEEESEEESEEEAEEEIEKIEKFEKMKSAEEKIISKNINNNKEKEIDSDQNEEISEEEDEKTEPEIKPIKIEKTEPEIKQKTIEKNEPEINQKTIEKNEKIKKTDKVEKTEQEIKPKKIEKADKIEKIDKIEKTEQEIKPKKIEKTDKIEKTEKEIKPKKSEKTDKIEKTEKEIKPKKRSRKNSRKDKMIKAEQEIKLKKTEKNEKTEKIDKIEKTEQEIKTKKMDKNDKNEKMDKIEKNEKMDKTEKNEKKEVYKKKIATKKKRQSKKNSLKNDKNDNIEVVKNKYIELYHKKYAAEIICMLKTLYLYKKIKDKKMKAVQVIMKNYLGYIARQMYREKYLVNKIMEERRKYANKIISFMKMVSIRKEIKILLQRLDDNYIAYSSLTGHKLLYFKIKYENNLEENLYFEYCKPLKAFILFVNKKEKNLSKKILEGSFYNENYKALVDPLYEQNSRGENIINFLQIFQKEEELEDKYDKVINDWVKKNRNKKKGLLSLGESHDNLNSDFFDDTNLVKSQRIDVKALLGNDKIPRSKSVMKLKGARKSKGILKPSKSYIKLKKEVKKVLFGEPQFKKYDNRK